VSTSQTVNDGTTFRLTGDNAFTYYEIWITRLGPGSDRAEISEVTAT